MCAKRSRKLFVSLLTAGALLAVALPALVSLSAQDSGYPGQAPVGPPQPVAGLRFAFAAGPAMPVAARAAVDGGVNIGQSYDGIDFAGSNCFCLPPDTNLAVGNDYVVEVVNLQIRVFRKSTGAVLLNQPLSAFFGAPSGGDPYVVYDDNADRWYVVAFDSTDVGLFLSVSNDGNPLNGFRRHHLTNVGGFPDYPKIGFNQDAIFVSYNDFGSGGAAATIASVDKAAALAGNLVYYISRPHFQFRAMPPAQMHNDKGRGGVEWFVSTDGTDAGGSTIRVTKMTNYLSNSPEFTYASLPVTPYKYASRALQPGGSITTFPNTTTTQVQYHNGRLTTAMASSVAADGYITPKGLYYHIDVNGNGAVKPRLVKEGVIDPGPGVAVQMPSAEEDQQGNLGFTWMESSSTEYLSMWVGNLYANGRFAASPAAQGGGLFYYSFRIGDYSAIVLDPSNRKNFWAANEYIGSDGASDIWRTHIASFTAR